MIAIMALRPTQVTVGRSEVDGKRRRWRDVKDKRQFLSRHRVPVLLGPNRHCYTLDRHHLARALLDEGVTQLAVTIWADLSRLSNSAFWTFLDNGGWCHPYDDRGRNSRRPARNSQIEAGLRTGETQKSRSPGGRLAAAPQKGTFS
jgi:hypothetical protein